MKKIFSIFCLAIFTMAFQACVRESLEAPAQPTITIKAQIPEEPLTKASFSVPASGVGLHLAWQAGDNIRIINGANSSVLNIQDGFTDHVAHFTGSSVPGDKITVIAPGTYTSAEAAMAGNPNLTQDGNGSTAHLVFTAMLGGVKQSDLSEIGFTDAWATEHSATLKKGGVVKFELTLPAAVTAPVNVTMTGIGPEVSVNIKNVSLTSSHVLTAYAQSGLEDVFIDANTNFTVSVTDANGSCYAATKTITSAAKLQAGAQNTITITNGFAETLFAGGDGSKENPYFIASAKQLDNMHVDGVLKHGERVYFRLVKDIDMESYLASNTWLPLNSLSPYDYIIDFDGNNHTINKFSCSFDSSGLTDPAHAANSKPSFFGLLYGSCYDVTFTNATITTNYGTSGVIGGYIGYTGKKAEVYNVHVKNSTINKTANSGDSGIGSFAGRIVFAYIESCSAENITINGTSVEFLGGLIGIALNDASRVRNCWTSGVIHGSQKLGGICGALINNESEVINCFSTVTLDAMRFAGGIVGESCLDANSGSPKHYTQATSLQPDNVIKGCIAWQSSFVTRDVRSPYVDAWMSGAIIGLTATKNYLIDCIRNSSLNTNWTEVNGVTPYDQENANPSNPLSISDPSSGVMKHSYPYHGKTATSSRLSTVAENLGWDKTVWDFSEDIPVLTGAVQVDGPGVLPSSGDANVPTGTNIDRAFPADGATLGGIKWKVVEIDTGIKYYSGTGTCTYSWMDDGAHRQDVYVVDYDLTNTDYEVKVVCASPSAVTSTVFAQTGAVAAINGGYEKASVAIKGNAFLNTETGDFYPYTSGYPYSYMPNNTIGDTGVANWKNEGTFYCDGKQGVRIAYDAYDGGCTDNNGSGTKVKDVKSMRNYYKLCTDGEAGFISSAPVLASNYTLFGRTFTSRNPGTGNSEKPAVHQSGAYPRTAVAIAYPDGVTPHLLLIVCDGRYDDSKGGYGMSAYWLTRFMANQFGPRYMLNLDGGGSTTMCVKDQGDATTNVVNYPSDNNGASGSSGGGTIHNHSGERARDTFIVIVPK